MSIINGRACVVNGTPVDKVFSNGRQVYGRNSVLNSDDMSKFDTWQQDGNSKLSDDKKEITVTSSHGGGYHWKEKFIGISSQ